MPNQKNYIQNISNLNIGQTIWRFPLPPSSLISKLTKESKIGLDTTKECIEIHFYNMETNEFITSVRIPLNENYLYIRELGSDNIIEFGLEMWNETDPENSLLTKYFSNIEPGYYNIVVYFLSQELGNLNNINWTIANISPSRNEILIETTNDTSTNIEQFVDKSMFFDDFSELSYFIFNKILTTSNDIKVLPLDEKNFIDFYSTLEKYTPEGRYYIQQTKNIEYQNKYQAALATVYEKIFNRIEQYLIKEKQYKRFRITKNNFNTIIAKIIKEEVQNHILLFPEGNYVTRAE